MLNRAFSADLRGDEAGLINWPPPYGALRWILEHRLEEDFVGNPRRHFQHLATRMSGPRPEVRSWRAWASWAIACAVNPDDPADEKQIAEEGIVEPELATIAESLARLGWSGEVDVWRKALGS
jgi:hypothetical protein